jgi:predicted DNA-binding transcriptional regulator AlpA
MPKITNPKARQVRVRKANVELNSLPKKQVSEKVASKLYGMSESWFRKMRSNGGGPKFLRIGRSIRYRVEDLDAFFNSLTE